MTSEDKRRDQVLERMLRTPPKPHKENKVKAGKSGSNHGKKGRK